MLNGDSTYNSAVELVPIAWLNKIAEIAAPILKATPESKIILALLMLRFFDSPCCNNIHHMENTVEV